MKREFLEAKGLEKDVVDSIMVEYGKDITAEQAKFNKTIEAKDGEIAKATAKISELEGEKSALSSKVADYDKVKNDRDTFFTENSKFKAEKTNNDIKKAIPSTVINKDAFFVHLDTSKIKIADDGKITGLDEQVESLKKTMPFFFDIRSSDVGGKSKDQTSDFAKMTMEDMQEL